MFIVHIEDGIKDVCAFRVFKAVQMHVNGERLHVEEECRALVLLIPIYPGKIVERLRRLGGEVTRLSPTKRKTCECELLGTAEILFVDAVARAVDAYNLA